MTRRSLTTHIDSESKLSDDFDKYVEMHHTDSQSSALQKLVAEGVKPYNNFRKYIYVLGYIWGSLLMMAGISGLLWILLENTFWLLTFRNSIVFVVISSAVIIGAGTSLMLQMARFEGKSKMGLMKDLLTGMILRE
jgi:hypothetical protein